MLFLATLIAAELTAPVTAAVVHGGQARLTRTAQVVVSGRERLELPLLPRGTDPDSVRVSVDGATLETVEIVRLGKNGVPVVEARAILAAGEAVREQLVETRAQVAALDHAATVADRPPQVPEGSEGWATVDPTRWRTTLDYLHRWRERTDRRREEVDGRLAELRQRSLELAQRGRALAARDEGKVRVVVLLAGQGPARVQASYVTPGASWSPRYEVRFDPARDQVSVDLVARAEQTTGDDWIAAALTFSTAQPLSTTALPPLPRWLIGERDGFIPTTVVPSAANDVPPSRGETAGEGNELRQQLLRLDGDEPAQRVTAREPVPKTTPAASPPAPRPGGPGAIVGLVFDQTGSPIKGVKVVVSMGSVVHRATYTNEEGAFRAPGLPPGTYDLEAMAPKLTTVLQQDIQVGAGAPAEVNLVMEVESGVEEVKVVEKAPVVSTSSATLKETYDDMDFVVALPSSPARTRTISLAPPPSYQRPRLAPGLPATLAGGHDLSFPALTPETLTSGALAQRIPLASWRWPVSVRRQFYPAVRPEGYLVATLRSPLPHPLPAGDATLFSDGQSVGQAQLALIRPGETFTLPLGIDRAVRAVRQVALEARREGLLDRRDVNRYTVTIDLANPHRRGVAIDVVDQVPQARDDSAAVRLVSSTPPAKVDEHGTIIWQTGVRAGATARFTFVYEIARSAGNRLSQ